MLIFYLHSFSRKYINHNVSKILLKIIKMKKRNVVIFIDEFKMIAFFPTYAVSFAF